MSNLFFSSAETLSAEEMKKKFLDTCRRKLAYCLVVREMDNPALSLLHQKISPNFWQVMAAARGQAIACRWSFTESIRKPDGKR